MSDTNKDKSLSMVMKPATIISIIFVLTVGVIQALTINAPSVNQEFVFSDAALHIQRGDMEGLNQFFQYQANSLGFPLLVALTGSVINVDASPMLSSAIVLAACLIIFFKSSLHLDLIGYRGTSALWLMMLMLCPMVWCIIGYGTSDLLPAALAFAGLLIVAGATEKNYKPLSLITASICFLLACALKYHALWFTFVAFILVMISRAPWQQRFSWATVIIGPSLLLIFAYAAWTNKTFGFVFMPDHFREITKGSGFTRIPMRLSLYLAFIGFSLGPMGLLFFLPQINSIKIRALFASFTVGVIAAWSTNYQMGEMNFGAASGSISKLAVQVIFFFGATIGTYALCMLLSKSLVSESKRQLIIISIGVVGYLIAISFLRPVQRYIVFVLPILFAAVLEFFQGEICVALRRTGYVLYIVLFLPICLAGQHFLASQGWAADHIAREAARLEIASQTDFGFISSHVGRRARWSSADNQSITSYRVTSGPSQNPIAKADVVVFGFHVKQFCLESLNNGSL